MKFGEKVRDLRKKHSLTQDELAKCLGVSKRTVIGWERDGRYPRNVEILEKMADIFHVPLTYIQPDQSLFIERAAATYGKKGKIEAQRPEIRRANTTSKRGRIPCPRTGPSPLRWLATRTAVRPPCSTSSPVPTSMWAISRA